MRTLVWVVGIVWADARLPTAPPAVVRQPTAPTAVERQPEGLVPFSVSTAAYWYRGVRGEVEKSLAIF